MMGALRERLKLYFVMGSVNCDRDPLLVLEEAIRGGITIFQFREKGPSALIGQEAYELAAKMQRVCQAYNVPFIVNDDIELALRLNADGLHIGQDDTHLLTARSQLPNKMIGVSARNADQARAAFEHGADYLGVGPMFPTVTKEDAGEVRGPQTVREIRQAGLSIPLVGIGGITSENAGSIIAAGADGIAVISSISRAASAQDEAGRLLREVNFFK